MKNKVSNIWMKLFVVCIIASLLVSACQTETPPAVTEPPVQEEAVATEPPVEVVEEPTEEVVEPEEVGVAPLDPPVDLKLAYVPIMKFATAYVAKELGFFEKYGLNVEMISVKSGTEAIAFLSEGKVDFGGVAIVVSLWNAWSQGMDLRIVAPGAIEPFTDSPTVFLVRKDLYDSGEITKVEDLAGKTVAVAGGPGSGGEYLAAKALERGNLTIFDVDLVNIGNADMPAAFENNSIVAGLLGSPYADQVINAGTAVAFEKDITPGLMTVAFIASGNMINDNPEVTQRFVLALMEAARAMQGDDYLSEENIAAYLAYINTTPEDIKTGVPVIYDPLLTIELEGLSDVERVHRENGRLDYTEPLDMKNVVDNQFVEWALANIK